MPDNLVEIYSLFLAGRSARENGQYNRASVLYEQAIGLAEAERDEVIGGRYAAIFRRNAAHSFYATSRLREALAVLSPLKRNAKAPSCCVYGNMTDHFRIALELPVSLQTIEANYREAESYFKSSGGSSWKSRILNMGAELLLARGMWEEARRAAEEGWLLRDGDCPNHYATTHLGTLVRINLARGDARAASKFLAGWEKHEEAGHLVSRVEYATLQSRLARLEGDIEGAVDRARDAVQLAEVADWSDLRYAAHFALARAFTVAGEHWRAGEVVARLAPLRRSESGHDRYAFQLLRGDYHLARARSAAGLPRADDEFYTAHGAECPHRAGQTGKAAREIQRARAAYRAAKEVGRWIDGQLECHARELEVSARLERADAIANS